MADFLSRLNSPYDLILVSDNVLDEHLFFVITKTPWFVDIANYLSFGILPSHFTSKNKRKIIKLSVKYTWVNGDLFYTSPSLLIRKCVIEYEILDILKSCHGEPCGGHFADKRTTYKVFKLGYYWPAIFKDLKTNCKRCDSCQRTGRPVVSDEMPLKLQVLIEQF